MQDDELTPGDLIRMTREALGLTIGEAAARARISKAFWSQVETNRRDFTYSKLLRIAATLQVPVAHLIPGEATSGMIEPRFRLTKVEAVELVDHLVSMDAGTRRHLIAGGLNERVRFVLESLQVKLGLSGTRMSHILLTTAQAVNKFLAGETDPRPTWAILLSKATNLSTEFFETGILPRNARGPSGPVGPENTAGPGPFK